MKESDIIPRTFRALDPTPVRVWSLIATLYGDCVLPRGGELWLGTLTDILGALGVEAGSVRAAMSRLARQGFLTRTRVGRTSHYALSDAARTLSRHAEAKIYRTVPPLPPAGWDMALIPKASRAARDALTAAGYRPAGTNVYARPATGVAPTPHAGVLHFTAHGDDAALATHLYDMEEVCARYHAFLSAADILACDASGVPGLEALSRRIALVHGFRRAVLRDPGLPENARPAQWPAHEAYRRFAAVYRTLAPASEAWLTATAQNASGLLPNADNARRFANDTA